MNQFDFPLDPVSIVFQGAVGAASFLFQLLSTFPLWMWVLAAALLCANRLLPPPVHRRQRRRYSHS